VTAVIDTESVRVRVRSRLLGRRDVVIERLSPPERRLRVREEVLAVLRAERAILPAGTITDVVNQVSDEVVGLGPLERLLRDPEVSEVMVDGGSFLGSQCSS
jgi:pilus assembly protein CpaF